MGDTLTNVWDGAWEDADSGKPMKGFGIELWAMRDGRIAIWEAAFNVGPADQSTSIGDLLR